MRLTRLLTNKEIELANDYSTREETKRKKSDYTILENARPFDAVNKLGQLEDIEEELGIDLITYFKLNNDGFYGFCKDDDHSKKYIHWFSPRNFCAFDDEIVVYYDGTDEVYKTFQYKNYGKKTINGWALMEEELL